MKANAATIGFLTLVIASVARATTPVDPATFVGEYSGNGGSYSFFILNSNPQVSQSGTFYNCDVSVKIDVSSKAILVSVGGNYHTGDGHWHTALGGSKALPFVKTFQDGADVINLYSDRIDSQPPDRDFESVSLRFRGDRLTAVDMGRINGQIFGPDYTCTGLH